MNLSSGNEDCPGGTRAKVTKLCFDRRFKVPLVPAPEGTRPDSVPVKDRLVCWRPFSSKREVDSPFSEEDIEQIVAVSFEVWAPSTAVLYHSGLTTYHLFCDEKGIPDRQRAPALDICGVFWLE